MKRIAYLLLVAALTTLHTGCRTAGTRCCHHHTCCPAQVMDATLETPTLEPAAPEPAAAETARRSISDRDDSPSYDSFHNDLDLPPTPMIDQEV